MIKIVYWSGTGNTEAMAGFVADGVKSAGKEASVVAVGEISADELAADNVFALGCPAMGDEVLEESEMEPFMEELEGKLAGKQVVLFGSYGWGNEEWMRSWEERVTAAGATVVNGSGIAVNGAPDDAAAEACKNAGAALAALV